MFSYLKRRGSFSERPVTETETEKPGPSRNRVKKFTFTWRVENYSYCWHKKGEQLVSPEFTIDNNQRTFWTIDLYPRGKTNKDFIGVYLFRSDDDNEPNCISVDYEISFLASDGSSLKFDGIEGYRFEQGQEFGWATFAEIKEILVDRRSEYLPQDSLTVQCTIWSRGRTHTHEGHSFARTRISVERISFVHVVKEVSSLQLSWKKTFNFLTENKPKSLISVSVFVTGGLFSTEKFMAEIASQDPNRTTIFTCKLYFIDEDGKSIECDHEDTKYLPHRKSVMTLPLNFPNSEQADWKSQLFPKDVLTLRCECTLTNHREFKEIEVTEYGLHMMSPLTPIAQNSHLSTVAATVSDAPSALDDLGCLYMDQILCDVTLKTQTKTFSAHKTVLCARSQVFKAMFSNDMAEKINETIQVDDLDDETLQRFLYFLYTDVIGDLEWDLACQLYYVADKYEVQALKLKCSLFLMTHIDVSNVIELLMLASLHDDSSLMRFVENFILEHDEEIFCSVAWKTFMKMQPHLAFDIMLLKYKKKTQVK